MSPISTFLDLPRKSLTNLNWALATDIQPADEVFYQFVALVQKFLRSVFDPPDGTLCGKRVDLFRIVKAFPSCPVCKLRLEALDTQLRTKLAYLTPLVGP